MWNFFIQTIISGVAWDLLKGTSKNILTLILYKIVQQNLGNETIQRLQNVVNDFPEEATKTKKEFLKYLKNNKEFQEITTCASKSKHISILNLKGNVYVQTTNFPKKFIITASFLCIALIVLLLLFYNNNSKETSGTNVKVFENKFIYGRYDGLKRIDNDILPLQDVDTYFYTNETELKNGNYIRVVKEQIETDVDYNIFKEGDDNAISTFECQLLASCACYAINHLHLSTSWTELPVEYIDGETGVYFGANNQCIYEKGIKNTVLYEGIDENLDNYFLVVKCLYVEEDGMMLTLLSYHGASYIEFMNSGQNDFESLKKCFFSMEQVRYQ